MIIDKATTTKTTTIKEKKRDKKIDEFKLIYNLDK
jgi:hypothetical protein